MSQAIIVCIITLVMAITFFTECIPLIAAAMGVPLLLQLTGVLTQSEAWSGFSNATVISFVPIFVMAGVLKKSSFTYRLKAKVKTLQYAKNGGAKVMAALVLSTWLLTTFMNAASATAVMIPIIISVATELGLPKKQTLKICADVSSNGIYVLPIGITLTTYLTYNAYLEAAGADSVYMFDLMDQTIMKAPIFAIYLLVMIFVAKRFVHPTENDADFANYQVSSSDNEKATNYTEQQDRLAIGMFFGSVLAMVIGVQILNIPIYLTCGIFAIACIAIGLISVTEAIASMSWISIIVIACTLPLATAFNKSGASDMIAGFLQQFIGGTSNTYILAAIFFIAPFIMTQFMSNNACAAVFSPLAVAVGIGMNMDPRFLLMACQFGAFSGFLTPMSTACEALAYEAGHFKMKEYVLCGLFPSVVWFALFMIWFPICAQYFL